MKDLIKEKIIKILREVNNDEVLELRNIEIEKLATMISCVVRSSIGIRIFFFSGISDILHEVQKKFEEEKKILLDKILGKKEKKILH